ncbi:MAG: DUF2948 family protein [Calditrichaceae bacterium]|jgi:hypothetical protein
MIKTTLKNIELISSYLHDALILSTKELYDKNNKIFTLNLERVFYENGRKEKFFFIVPMHRFKTIESKLLITDVNSFSQRYIDKELNSFGEQYRLLEIELKEKNDLRIIGEHIEIILTVTNNSNIILEDTSIPSKKYKVTDLSRTIFPGLDEIEKLKYGT